VTGASGITAHNQVTVGVWVGDSRIQDFMVRVEGLANPIRPWLTLFICMKSYVPMGWHLHHTSFSAEQFDGYLKEFDIDNKQAMINKLSHGQKKKVFIAFGLATNTKLLLMDEPTNGLDIPSKGQFRRMVASGVDENRCLIISTHQVHDLDSLIDNILIMEKHEIVFKQSLENISKKLLFKVSDRNDMDINVLYSEDNLRGLYQICKNPHGEESKVDIELLFNAVLNKTKEITQIF
jgi:ABC-2 type transport system ATP-binding protein